MATNFDLISERELRSLVSGAVERAAKKVQGDLLMEARRNIQKYYDQYDPDIYIRTDNLRNGVDHIPILRKGSSGSLISFEVGFQYDGSKMGAYPDGGDPVIVFKNFLDGIHPNTFVHGKSQDELMDWYVDKYLGKKIDGYMQSELIAALSKLM